MTLFANSAQQRTAYLSALFSLGFVWHRGLSDPYTSAAEVNKAYPFFDYPNLVVKLEHGSIAGESADFTYGYTTLDAIIEMMTKPYSKKAATSVKLNQQYSAEIKPGSPDIQVGCQTISIDAIRAVVAAYDDLVANPPIVPTYAEHIAELKAKATR